jgi:hypothetical protein
MALPPVPDLFPIHLFIDTAMRLNFLCLEARLPAHCCVPEASA